MRADRPPLPPDKTVVLAAELRAIGWTRHQITAQVAGQRWQRAGRSLVLHNAELTAVEGHRVALLNAGRRAAFTAFTALELLGLTGWSRSATHVVLPAGAHVSRVPGHPLVAHYRADWESIELRRPGVHAPAPAALVAAASMRSSRAACAILAAAVQQRLVTAAHLATALRGAGRIRHRAVLTAAVRDIGQGSEALSEIDFVALCRRHRLPEPERQVIRRDSRGRRRYLDAEFRRRRDGRRVVVEIDGAVHLDVERWWSDQSRQNEITLDGDTLVLRFPSVALYTDELGVVQQLRRALD